MRRKRKKIEVTKQGGNSENTEKVIEVTEMNDKNMGPKLFLLALIPADFLLIVATFLTFIRVFGSEMCIYFDEACLNQWIAKSFFWALVVLACHHLFFWLVTFGRLVKSLKKWLKDK